MIKEKSIMDYATGSIQPLLLIFILCLCIYQNVEAANNILNKPSVIRQSATTANTSNAKNKIDRFLNDVKKARTKQDILRSFKKANIPSSQLPQLSLELKKTGLSSRISNTLNLPASRPVQKKKANQVQKKLTSLQTRLSNSRKKNLQARNNHVKRKLKTVQRQPPPRPGRAGVAVQPAIQSLSNTIISPGQMLLISGKNFQDRRGQVRFNFQGTNIPAIIDQWADNSILVHLNNNVSGLLPKHGVVRVKNASHKEASHPISFQPSEEIKALEDKACNLPLFTENVDTVIRSLQCSVMHGDVNGAYALHDFRSIVHNVNLINGWKVVDYYLGPNIFPEVTYVTSPRINGIHPRSEISVKQYCLLCNKPPSCVTSTLFIQGPRGTPALSN